MSRAQGRRVGTGPWRGAPNHSLTVAEVRSWLAWFGWVTASTGAGTADWQCAGSLPARPWATVPSSLLTPARGHLNFCPLPLSLPLGPLWVPEAWSWLFAWPKPLSIRNETLPSAWPVSGSAFGALSQSQFSAPFLGATFTHGRRSPNRLPRFPCEYSHWLSPQSLSSWGRVLVIN